MQTEGMSEKIGMTIINDPLEATFKIYFDDKVNFSVIFMLASSNTKEKTFSHG